MKNNLKTALLMLMAISILTAGCEKFLEKKSDASFATPETLKDLQALLDYHPNMTNKDPGTGEASSDSYYLADADYDALSANVRRLYTWEPDNIFERGQAGDWGNSYTAVYYTNTVLENLPKVGNEGRQFAYDDIMGQALFHRSRIYFAAATVFAKAYDDATAENDYGVVLRTGIDFNIPSERVSQKATYSRILEDLKRSVQLLPLLVVNPVRPSKASAYALLSRVYLSMRKYEEAGKYADSCLALKSDLIDFNTLSTTATYPIVQSNIEVLLDSRMGPQTMVTPKVDPSLYNSYATNDLRKTVFYKAYSDGTYYFRGQYTGSIVFFSGITVSEILLNRAECFARKGEAALAIKDLNTLLKKRYKTGTFTDYAATTPAAALALILTERRKELAFRNLRWMDLKRLNKDGAGITLTRVVKGITYTLLPNDPRYALAIPEDVIEVSRIPQNPR